MISSAEWLSKNCLVIKQETEFEYSIIIKRKTRFLKERIIKIGSFFINNFPNNDSIKILNNLFINKDYRGRGYCKEVLTLIDETAINRRVKILCFTTKNIALLKASKKLDFQINNEYINSDEETVYLISKTYGNR